MAVGEERNSNHRKPPALSALATPFNFGVCIINNNDNYRDFYSIDLCRIYYTLYYTAQVKLQ